VKPWVAALHVFSWWPRDERLPLAARAELWQAALAEAGDVDALLEFVPGDDPEAVVRDAGTLWELHG
jgi:3-dehydroshikimate dehydratase